MGATIFRLRMSLNRSMDERTSFEGFCHSGSHVKRVNGAISLHDFAFLSMIVSVITWMTLRATVFNITKSKKTCRCCPRRCGNCCSTFWSKAFGAFCPLTLNCIMVFNTSFAFDEESMWYEASLTSVDAALMVLSLFGFVGICFFTCLAGVVFLVSRTFTTAIAMIAAKCCGCCSSTPSHIAWFKAGNMNTSNAEKLHQGGGVQLKCYGLSKRLERQRFQAIKRAEWDAMKVVEQASPADKHIVESSPAADSGQDLAKGLDIESVLRGPEKGKGFYYVKSGGQYYKTDSRNVMYDFGFSMAFAALLGFTLFGIFALGIAAYQSGVDPRLSLDVISWKVLFIPPGIMFPTIPDVFAYLRVRVYFIDIMRVFRVCRRLTPHCPHTAAHPGRSAYARAASLSSPFRFAFSLSRIALVHHGP